jgi:GntR family transcriptional regulator / MocR family aminotransferase
MLPPNDSEVPAYRWLYESLRREILDGRLRPGARLPATRDLARYYGLSRGTIINAFEQLKAEGYVEAAIGSGSFVASVLPDELLHVRRDARGERPSPTASTRRLSDFASRVKLFPEYETRPARAFRANHPALDLFPVGLWTQLTGRRLRRASMSDLLGCSPMGYRPLREAVADYVNSSRGVKCMPGQVAVLSGVQEALDLVVRLLLNPGDRVAMENPGYVGAAIAFEGIGAKIVLCQWITRA